MARPANWARGWGFWRGGHQPLPPKLDAHQPLVVISLRQRTDGNFAAVEEQDQLPARYSFSSEHHGELGNTPAARSPRSCLSRGKCAQCDATC